MSSSRKRTEGNDRNLENRAREEQVQHASPPHLAETGGWEFHCRWGEQAENVMCSHGCVIPHPGHPVYDFMHTFHEEMYRGNLSLSAMELTFQHNHEVWKDSAMRKMATKIMVNIGANFILRNLLGNARDMTAIIILLEEYKGEGQLYSDSVVSAVAEDFGCMPGAGERDVVHFYNKRMPCSCLRTLYSELKRSQEKASTCFHCDQSRSRKTLMACSSCKCAYYCSKKCQRLDWPSHKKYCNWLQGIGCSTYEYSTDCTYEDKKEDN